MNGVNITSDARMKDNIQPIENPIDVLSRVDGVSYTYRLSEVQKIVNRKKMRFLKHLKQWLTKSMKL